MGLCIENRALRARIEILEDCSKRMASIYRELAKVTDRNGQALEEVLWHTVTAVTDLTNIVIEQEMGEDDK